MKINHLNKMIMKQILILIVLCGSSLTSLVNAQDPLTIENRTKCKALWINNSEIVTFQSGKFSLSGIFVKPDTVGTYPVIVFNHGDSRGYVNKTSNDVYWIIWNRFLELGYAVFSWDTPGAGKSTGEHNWNDSLFTERTEIVLSALEYLKKRNDVDSNKIGLFGHSQAGYIMPLVISKSDDIAFMINLSGPAMNSIDQGAYLIRNELLQKGFPTEYANKYATYYSKCSYADDYEDYLHNARLLNEQPYLRDTLKWAEIISEDKFQPVNNQSLYAPYDLLKKISIPVLAIFGEKDQNVNASEDSRLYIEALVDAKNPNFIVLIFPAADHSICGIYNNQL